MPVMSRGRVAFLKMKQRIIRTQTKSAARFVVHKALVFVKKTLAQLRAMIMTKARHLPLHWLLYLEARLFGRIKPRPWHRKLGGIRQRNEFQAYLHEDSKVMYLVIPKSACTSLRRSFLESEAMRERLDRKKKNARRHKDFFSSGDIFHSLLCGESDKLAKIKALSDFKGGGTLSVFGYDEAGRTVRKADMAEFNAYFTFTFVRNPFARLVSCFADKYLPFHSGSGRYSFQYHIFPYIDKVCNFEDLAHKVSHLPDDYLDRHLLPQFRHIERFTRYGGKVNFIGKVKTLAEDFAPIQKKYGLLPLEKINSSGKKNWRDYYTPETAKLVYNTYRKDFELFGYEEEYPKLLAYLGR